MKRAYEKMKKENETLKNENRQIKKELNEVKQTTEQIEKEKKKSNVVIFGMEKKETDGRSITNQAQNLFKNQMQIDIQINRAFRIGTNACLIELKNVEDKETVMKNKHKLRNLKGEERIYINEDLTINERKKQAEIRKIGKIMTNEGKKVKLGYSKITVDGEEWKWNKTENKLEKTKN